MAEGLKISCTAEMETIVVRSIESNIELALKSLSSAFSSFKI